MGLHKLGELVHEIQSRLRQLPAGEVAAACEQHPEWQLRSIHYDGGDTTLMGLAGLITDMDADHLRAALMRLAKRAAGD